MSENDSQALSYFGVVLVSVVGVSVECGEGEYGDEVSALVPWLSYA